MKKSSKYFMYVVMTLFSFSVFLYADTEGEKPETENVKAVEKKDKTKNKDATTNLKNAKGKEDSNITKGNILKSKDTSPKDSLTKSADSTTHTEKVGRIISKGKADSTAPAANSISSVKTGKKDSTGVLIIVTDPDSAFVIFDGTVKGISPLILKNIQPGTHSLVFKKKGCYVKKVEVNVAPGSKESLTFQMKRPAELIITSEPSGAILAVNNKKAGNTPYTNTKLKPGQYIVELGMDGYESAKSTLNIKSGARDSVHIALEKIKKVPEEKKAVVAEKEKQEEKEEEKEKKEEDEKSRLRSILNKVALGVFVGFSLIVLLIELAQDK